MPLPETFSSQFERHFSGHFSLPGGITQLLGSHSTWVHGGIWLLAIFLCLLLAAILTPRHWWRRPTVLGLLGLAGGSFLLAQVLLQCLPGTGIANTGMATAIASITAPPPATIRATFPAESIQSTIPDTNPHPFRVHQALNLRQQAGTDAPLITTLPAGSNVWLTGKRQGDWWQVNTPTHAGWVSSLWLRQAEGRQ